MSPVPMSYTPAATTHGRFIVEPAGGPPAAAILGFHGYAESGEEQLERLRAIPGASAWTLVAVQALHRFYRGRGANRQVVASWMTRQDRELAIDDNLAYVRAVAAAVARDHGARPPTVFAGFSQGVAMAFRAAALLEIETGGVIAFGGDVPPEIARDHLARIPRVLLGRGRDDERYPHAQWTSDAARLRAAGVRVDAIEVDAGHAWTPAFSEAAGAWLGFKTV